MENYINIHDFEIYSYEVNIEQRIIQMFICDDNTHEKNNYNMQFLDVLTHHFEDVSFQNVIFEIEEYEIEKFITQYCDFLEEKRKDCWPIYYENKEDLVEYLSKNLYKVYLIDSSNGLHGFVIAKEMQILKVQKDLN